MDTWTGSWKIAALAMLSVWLTACGSSPPSSATASAVAPVAMHPPTVEVVAAPERVCRAATQVRIQLQTSQDLVSDLAGEWQLRDAQGQAIQQGAWPVRDGAVLISFPQGQPLPSGDYVVGLSWQGTGLAEHRFSVDSRVPTIADLFPSVTPDGSAVLRLPPHLRGFYIGYEFQGGCLGAPYWATVWNTAGEVLCNQSGVLVGTEEQGAFACYRADGETLAAGDYRVEVTLMEEAVKGVDFVVEAEPLPPTSAPTSVAPPVVCDGVFAAAGLTAEGEPFLPLTLFDWYTQAIYAGARCRNLYRGVGWHTTWVHEGELVREGRGEWQGPTEGSIWDSLTGVPGNPFLPPGAYIVTLTIEDLSTSTAFSVFQYEPATTTKGDVITE